MSTTPRAEFRSLRPAMCVAAAFCAGAAAFSAARADDEIVCARRVSGQLIGHVGFPQPLNLDPSPFPGIDGYATGIYGFANAEIDEPEFDVFKLNPNSDIQAVLTSIDPGIIVHDGLHILQVGEAMSFGPPSFDYHPIFNITDGHPGQIFTMHFYLHDVSGIHPDSDIFAVTFTPTNPCPPDINGDGVVSSSDLALLLGAWGTSGLADLDASGSVGSSDLALLLGAWGPCP